MRSNLVFARFLPVILVSALAPAQSVVSTIAGGSTTGPGDTGSAALAFLNKPAGVTLAKDGSLIIVDRNDQRIRKVDTKGIISTIAGSGIAGYQDGPAAQAQFNFPEFAKVDSSGNIYVTEFVGHRVRKIDISGNVTTIAGTGSDGDSGDGCPATAASFHQPYGLAVDGAGNVFISDFGANRVRRINTGNCIATVLGTGTSGFAGDGTVNATLNGPQGLAYDTNANVLYIADTLNQRIRKVDYSPTGNGIVSTFAGCGAPGSNGCPSTISSTPTTATKSPLFSPQDVAIGPDGVYVLDLLQGAGGYVSLIYRVDNTGALTPLYSLGSSSGFQGASLTVVSQTQIYVSEALYTRTVQLVTGAGPQRYAGGGTLDGVAAVNSGVIGPVATNPLNPALTNMPAGIKTDTLGNVYFSDYGENRVRKIDTNGVISTVAGNGILLSGGDGGSAVLAALAGPMGIDLDSAGNLYIAETFSNKIRMVSPSGTISTFAGTGQAGQCTAVASSCGDGGKATSATMYNPTAVAVDRNTGSVYIVDNGNSRIRKVDSSGIITTYAGSVISSPCNNGVSLSCGDGGAATSAELSGPIDIVLDASGNLYILERFLQVSLNQAYAGSRIRRVDAGTQKISTIAGNGLFDASGEGSAALSASLGTPSGLAIDKNNGNLFVSDDRNQRILKVTGTVNRLVGNLTSGFNGDGLDPLSTEIQRPQGLALDGGGNLLFWDAGNNRLRKVPGIGTASPETMASSGGNHQTANVTQALPQKVAVIVLNGSAPVSGVQVQFTVTPANAATLSPITATTDSTGTASTQVTLGSAAGAFTITATSTGLPTVTFNETALAVLGATTVGAGFATIPLSPGAIGTLFGQGMAAGAEQASVVPLPTTLATSTSISIVGSTQTLQAPLYYVSPTQINFQLPFEVTDASVNLVVNSGGSSSAPLPVSVASTSPGIFITNSASGQGAIIHALTYALVSAANPAKVGEVVSIYCTGLGVVNPPVASGTATPANGTLYNASPVTVTIGGSNAVVSFAGLAPGFVGLYQVNAVVPNIAAGNSVPVLITAGSVTSNSAIMQVSQ
jgi:uncharacterized protein (TIGR03437 family)